jgi:hypothetical protein
MMSHHPFEAGVLLWPSLAIFLTVFLVCVVTFREPTAALAIGALKAGLFFSYFGWFFDGTFTYLDDWTYLERGADLHDQGAGLLNLWHSFPVLLALGEGQHFVYYVFNAVALEWFGQGYFAPVALNVIITAFIAMIGTRLVAIEQLVSQRRAKLFFVFLLLHPDLTAWSTFVNGKDTLVLLLHVLLLYAFSLLLRGHRGVSAVVLGAFVVTVLLFLRFYVPLIFAVALILSFLSNTRGLSRWRLTLGAFFSLGGLFVVMDFSLFVHAFESIREDFVNPAVGLVRFLLTPIPFNTEASFAFLDGPALLHWLLLPALLLGAREVFRMKTSFSRFLVFYALTFVTLYAVYGELQGPRHRVQLDFVIALFQFAGVSVLVSGSKMSSRCAQTAAVEQSEIS